MSFWSRFSRLKSSHTVGPLTAESAVERWMPPQDELFLLSNVYPESSGLPFIVWISCGYEGVPYDIRVKITRERNVRPSEMITVALRPIVHVTNGELSEEELSLLSTWVRLNWEALLQHWENETDSKVVLDQLKRVDEQ
jgi:hypothetical protein